MGGRQRHVAVGLDVHLHGHQVTNGREHGALVDSEMLQLLVEPRLQMRAPLLLLGVLLGLGQHLVDRHFAQVLFDHRDLRTSERPLERHHPRAVGELEVEAAKGLTARPALALGGIRLLGGGQLERAGIELAAFGIGHAGSDAALDHRDQGLALDGRHRPGGSSVVGRGGGNAHD